VSINRAAADQVIGARHLIENDEWIAVAGTNWWAAARALNALDPRYALPEGQPTGESISAALAAALDSGDSSTIFSRGSAGSEGAGISAINQRYEVAPAPSAAIEPLTATARMTDDRLEIWAPTLAPSLARAAAARATGFAEERVTLYPTLAGGGYGRKLETRAIEQAAVIAQRLGRPVQVTWPRIQEIQRDSWRPPAAAQMTAWVAGGRIQAWQTKIAAPESASETARRLRASGNFFRPDGGPAAGAVHGYEIANLAVDHVPVEIGLETGIDRGGAHAYTCFFTESFIDEIARAAGQEPLSYRMAMLGNNPRLARCLATATAIGGWDGGPPGSGMGIACHSAFGSYVACLVEVEVGRDQRVHVLRAVCAVDCGRVIHPEIVKQQIEGGLIHGVSAAVAKPIAFANGRPDARTIGAFGLPTLRDAPEVTVELLDSDEEPGGVTELAVPVAAPAVANAYFSLSGQRVRRLPILIGGIA
jgi:isoquinoline 1-oxidoreductase beta subunit